MPIRYTVMLVGLKVISPAATGVVRRPAASVASVMRALAASRLPAWALA
jgi:hypothetical protein